MSPLRNLLAVLLLIACSPVNAAAAPPSPAATMRLLQQRAFSELEQQFGAVQAAYAAGQINDEELRAAFRSFYPSDHTLAPAYDEWVKKSPKSYVAHLARGIYYKRVGAERRGTAYAANTSEEQFDGMRQAHDIATVELQKSLELDNRPLLSYAHSMDIEMNAGNADQMRKLLDAALRIDPKSIMAREKYMGSLRTEWGGSTRQMREFYAECEASGNLSAQQLGVLDALIRQNERRYGIGGGADLETAVRE